MRFRHVGLLAVPFLLLSGCTTQAPEQAGSDSSQLEKTTVPVTIQLVDPKGNPLTQQPVGIELKDTPKGRVTPTISNLTDQAGKFETEVTPNKTYKLEINNQGKIVTKEFKVTQANKTLVISVENGS
ncbi:MULTISPECIES: hypothetical protein [unclassified Thermoactinomyces]|uniref:hypothetical protein n=1 Tax=unclassified Thermoactinomyces TaxID=2634588 RepID=UPI0018DB4038|nr:MULTISPECIES: hypothetical protein [unclassified Thermoactinomyces]MBH8597668.1 hypothetical protein [Thermoactinomyces sp. CICC 10523]MBH8604009.1 hypothetical protein [Thermoactinomyces sp. CICC 10522]MBH8606457.1 hypothetical protein [Thermoactinomyces sp. CICC 10521]